MFRRFAASGLIAAGFLIGGQAEAGFKHDVFRHDFPTHGFRQHDFPGHRFDFGGKSRLRRHPFAFPGKFHANFAKPVKPHRPQHDFFDFFRPDFDRHHVTPFGKRFKH